MNSLFLLALMACGRPTTDIPVRPVGVGMNPEEIGPSPTAYGGVVEYDHVELAGGGLALAHMGLGSMVEVGPQLIGFAPPYSGILGFSYLFDRKIPAADALAFVGSVPPSVEDTCYTAFSPNGPIGSFTTLDVGDYMEFATADGSSQFRMGRVPADFPPDPQGLFIYYSSVEDYAPVPRKHRVPGNSDDPRNMVEQVWRPANYPFGQIMNFRFPGGLTRFDQPVGSIPRPSSTVGNAEIQIPSAMGGVLLEWEGPRFSSDGESLGEGLQTACIEYYGERDTSPTTPEDCNTAPALPNALGQFDKFPGQIYTGPWDASDGKVTLKWTPQEHGDQVALTVRFMAPFDTTDPSVQVPRIDDRPAGTCEQDDAEWVLDPSLLDEDGDLNPALQGDPSSRMAEVTCLLADDGSYTLDVRQLAEAMDYAETQQAGGVVFFLSRGSETEVTVPLAKDQYDQGHDISPVKVTTRAVKVGRFHWGASGGGE